MRNELLTHHRCDIKIQGEGRWTRQGWMYPMFDVIQHIFIIPIQNQRNSTGENNMTMVLHTHRSFWNVQPAAPFPPQRSLSVNLAIWSTFEQGRSPTRPEQHKIHHVKPTYKRWKRANSLWIAGQQEHQGTDPIEIPRIITSLVPIHSSGHDGISSKLLKYLDPSISKALCTIINTSLESGFVPMSMKAAKGMPIFKSKAKTDVNNNIPISLLPSLSNILEKVVHHRLCKFLTINDILYENRYGFHPKHSNLFCPWR